MVRNLEEIYKKVVRKEEKKGGVSKEDVVEVLEFLKEKNKESKKILVREVIALVRELKKEYKELEYIKVRMQVINIAKREGYKYVNKNQLKENEKFVYFQF